MAAVSKKDKLIEEAQKLVLRGQFDKAAKVYEQIIALEPNAVNLRQKLAELLIKCGRADDARKEFEIIGKHFSKNGFYLKAIAVYKQLQKLFPADISISVTLAELNEKHGLVANALSEYKTVYEYHEKNGAIPEALSILNKMQNVDPQNLPIKIKLGESYIQHGKRVEAFTVFCKAAAMLLERNDSATLARIRARIQQLFPDKPEFLLDILADQLTAGNAGAIIDTIQGELRSNPDNKRAWDIVVQAYQQLNQPQKVKIAFQHYLKFFPNEPVAMQGVIDSLASEKNLSGALELLDRFETTLIAAGYLQQLEQTYHALDRIDPINVRVVEGLIRVQKAAGNEGEVIALISRLKSLHSVTGGGAKLDTPLEADPFFQEPAENAASPFFDDSIAEMPQELEEVIATSEDDAIPEVVEPPALFQEPDEELEIDIEIDLDSPFAPLEEESGTPLHDNWLDSVGDLFDTISTAPSAVKFGNDMESSDAQSHFDLGQAFKEMGLYDEAIKEFRQASNDPSRRIECMIMQCSCLRERGEVDKAVSMLRALIKPGISEEEECAVKYELATAYEVCGNKEEATLLLNEISTTNPSFRDIRSRLNAANLADSLDFSDEDLDDFGL